MQPQFFNPNQDGPFSADKLKTLFTHLDAEKLQLFKDSIGQPFKVAAFTGTGALANFDTIREVREDGTVVGDWTEAYISDCRLKQEQPYYLKPFC